MTALRRMGATFLQGALPFVPLVLLWELVVRLGVWPEQFLPSPFSVPRALGEMITGYDLLLHVGLTLWRVTLAGVVGSALGLALGVLVSINRRVADALNGLIQFLQAVGEVGWLPMLVLWSGFNQRTIIIAVCYTIFFPVFFGTVTGFAAVPKNLKDSVLTLGGSARHLLAEVMLPGSLPAIITGFRTGMGFGWRTVILAEMLVGEQGLGVLLFKARELFIVAWVMVGMVVAGVLWLLTDELVLRPLEARTIQRWGLVR